MNIYKMTSTIILCFFLHQATCQTFNDAMPTAIPPKTDTASVVKPGKETDGMPIAKPGNLPVEQGAVKGDSVLRRKRKPSNTR